MCFCIEQALDLQPGTQCGWVSVTQQMLVHFVKGQFPVKKDPPPEGAGAPSLSGECCMLQWSQKRLLPASCICGPHQRSACMMMWLNQPEV